MQDSICVGKVKPRWRARIVNGTKQAAVLTDFSLWSPDLRPVSHSHFTCDFSGHPLGKSAFHLLGLRTTAHQRGCGFHTASLAWHELGVFRRVSSLPPMLQFAPAEGTRAGGGKREKRFWCVKHQRRRSEMDRAKWAVRGAEMRWWPTVPEWRMFVRTVGFTKTPHNNNIHNGAPAFVCLGRIHQRSEHCDIICASLYSLRSHNSSVQEGRREDIR